MTGPVALTAALATRLCETSACTGPPPCAEHRTAAAVALEWLTSAGVILPVGITISALWLARHVAVRDGFEHHEERLRPSMAAAVAWLEEQGGGCVETAWRFQGEDFDLQTHWRAVDG